MRKVRLATIAGNKHGPAYALHGLSVVAVSSLPARLVEIFHCPKLAYINFHRNGELSPL